MAFGTPDEKRAICDHVSKVHRKVRGPDYTAFDPELQLWVAATLYDTSLLLYERWLGPLDEVTADKVYRQYRLLGTALQMRDAAWPADRAAFRVYWNRMLDSLEVTEAARGICREFLHPKRIPLLLRAAMPLNRLVTSALLPARLRAAYGLEWSSRQQRRFERVSGIIGAVYPRLPLAVRQLPKTWCLWDMRRGLARTAETRGGGSGD